MRKMKNLPTIIIFSVLTLLLVAAVISTIVLAFFSSAKKASVSLGFADSVTLEVQGIDNSHHWQIATAGATSTYIVDDATLSAPFFENIGVKVTQGTGTRTSVVVRVFAIVYTTNSSISAITASTGTTTVTSANYTAQEQALITSVPKNSSNQTYAYSALCVTKEFTAVGTSFTSMINDFYPLTQTLTTANLGKKMQGLVVVTAKNKNSGATISTADWNGIIDFNTNGIKWA